MASFGFLASGNDGSSWYRAQLPARALSWLKPKAHVAYERPHKIMLSTQMTDEMARCDVIVGARVAHPGAMPVWRRLKEDGKRLVLDLDDFYFKIDPSNKTAYNFWVHGIDDRSKQNHGDGTMLANLRTNIELSDVVTVCSEGLAEAIYKTTLHPNIKVIENALDAGVAGVKRNYNPEILKIGWAGTENTAAWLPMIKDVVNKAAADKYGKRVYIEFVGVPGRVAGGMGFRFRKGYGRCIEFIHDMRAYATEVATFDILLAPYRSTEFTEAKFPTKALEAGFMGIPLIASHIRPYADWITHGKTGFLVRNNAQHEWGRYLGALIEDAGLRRSMGMEARDRASENSLQDYLGEAWERACLD